MAEAILALIGLSFAGFVVGLSGKSISVKKKSLRMNDFYKILTLISLVLMFVFAILYQFV